MTFTGGNLSIKNHEANGKEIHLFEADKNTKNRGYWRYVDQLRFVEVKNYRNLDDKGDESILVNVPITATIKLARNVLTRPIRLAIGPYSN